MGVLKQREAVPAIALAARSLVGRAPGCLVRLDDPRASAEHASIFWTGARWEVRDLASRNGTFVDGTRLEPGKRVALREGAELAFGSGAEAWVLVDALPPVASAKRKDTGEVRVAADGLLALPNEADPRVSVLEDNAGGWTIEDGGRARPATDGEEVALAGDGTWTLSVPPPVPEGFVETTRKLEAAPTLVGALALHFTVSRDEEHVEIVVAHGDGERTTALPPRAHHYLLLTLARARLDAAREPETSPEESGWLYADELCDMLRIDPQHLAVNIFRARQQLAAAGVVDAGAIIERRATTRQIRLGTVRATVRTT